MPRKKTKLNRAGTIRNYRHPFRLYNTRNKETRCKRKWRASVNSFEPWHDKTNKMSVRPAKTQISLGIRPVWTESSLCAHLVAKDLSFLQADSEDFHQTWRMPRLIWVFAGRTITVLVCHVVAHLCLASHVGKQCRHRSDAAECGVQGVHRLLTGISI